MTPTFEEAIIVNSSHRLAKLYTPAKKAYETPSNGITINIPAAAAVIQDCAFVTVQYLPHFIFGMYGNPFGELHGKITIDQIKDFVARSTAVPATLQLLRIILAKGAAYEAAKPIIADGTPQNPYGDYENITQQQVHDNVYILSKLFGVV